MLLFVCGLQLAAREANEESLLIARLDGTANDVPGLTVPAAAATAAAAAGEGEGEGGEAAAAEEEAAAGEAAGEAAAAAAAAAEAAAAPPPDVLSTHGYPAVVFFPKTTKKQQNPQPIVYTGPRSMKALKSFIAGQATVQPHEDL